MKVNYKFKLELTPSTRLVPHNFETYLVGAFYKWLKGTDKHGKDGERSKPGGISLSHFCNYKRQKNGVVITKDSFLILSGDNTDYLKVFYENIKKDPKINWGVEVKSMEIINEENYWFLFMK